MTTSAKFWRLLTPHYRRAAVVLLGVMIVGMLLETLGVSLMIPAMALMARGDIGVRFPAVAPFLARIGNPSHERLLVDGMVILVGVFAVKASLLGFLAWIQMRFVYGVQAEMSQRLFSGYLRQPYAFHLVRNSAELIRNVANETAVFAQTGLVSAFNLLSESFVLCGLTVLLLTIEPVGALVVVLTAGAAGWASGRLTRKRVRSWGVARQLHEGIRLQRLQEGFGGVKDVKLLGREGDFLARFSDHNAEASRVSERQSALMLLPRLWLELLAVGGLAGLVLVMVWRGKPIEGLLPTLAVFAAAAFRLMPSANRVLVAVDNIRYALPVIDVLHHEMAVIETVTPLSGRSVPDTLSGALNLENVTFSYAATTSRALSDITLSIPRGSSVGFIGGSGAGKSTLVDVILGLLTPTSGTVRVGDKDIQSNLRGWQNQIGYVPQFIFLTDDTLRRNVAFGLADADIDDTAVRRAIRAAQLDQLVSELPLGLETPVGERGVRLSGGQRQRIGIARALYHDPPVLVMDEATSSLDTATERGVVEAVRALQGAKTLIIVAHRLSTVEYCQRLVRLESGRVVEQGDAETMLKALVSPAS